MSKNILILSSSPRVKGNSNALCDEFIKGAVETNHQVEKVVLAEKKINYCKGCYACRGDGRCAQKDDMAPILDAMVAADAIVLATPVYFYTMCAQMKTLIDRTVAQYTKITNKEFFLSSAQRIAARRPWSGRSKVSAPLRPACREPRKKELSTAPARGKLVTSREVAP